MKKSVVLILLLSCLFCISACNSEENKLDAEIYSSRTDLYGNTYILYRMFYPDSYAKKAFESGRIGFFYSYNGTDYTECSEIYASRLYDNSNEKYAYSISIVPNTFVYLDIKSQSYADYIYIQTRCCSTADEYELLHSCAVRLP